MRLKWGTKFLVLCGGASFGKRRCLWIQYTVYNFKTNKKVHHNQRVMVDHPKLSKEEVGEDG